MLASVSGGMPVSALAARLPEAETVRRWSQSLAVLDAILGADWEHRYFSFDAHWDDGEQLASMRNGSGAEYSIVFSRAGAYVRGFDHESSLSPWAQSPPALWPGLVDDVPTELEAAVTEPAFCDGTLPRLTVCLWRLAGAPTWSHGRVALPDGDPDADGADRLFEQLDGEPATYRAFAREYWERELDLEAIARVYRHEPLTEELVAALAPDRALADLADDLAEIGYPRG